MDSQKDEKKQVGARCRNIDAKCYPVLLSYCLIFIVELEVGAVIKRTAQELTHLVFIQIHLAFIIIALHIINIVYTGIAFCFVTHRSNLHGHKSVFEPSGTHAALPLTDRIIITYLCQVEA